MTTRAAEAPVEAPAQSASPADNPALAAPRGDAVAVAIGGVALVASLALLGWGLSRGTGARVPMAVHWAGEQAVEAADASATVTGPAAAVESAGVGSRGLAALPTAIERQAALLDDAELDALSTRGVKSNTGRIEGEIPRAQRWEVFILEGLTLADYSQQLDGVGIEIGMLTGDGAIEYVTGVSQAAPARRQGAASDERRLYLAWTRADLLAADRELLAQVGLDAKDKVVLQFFTEEIEKKLADLELAFANRPADKIYRTRFGIQKSITGFEFHVIEQTPR